MNSFSWFLVYLITQRNWRHL